MYVSMYVCFVHLLMVFYLLSYCLFYMIWLLRLLMLMVMIGSFEQLIIYIAFALNIFLWLAVVGIFIARKKKVGEESAVKVWGYPVVPVFFLFSSIILMVFNYINRPMESSAAMLTVLFGIPCYFLWVRGSRKSKIGG